MIIIIIMECHYTLLPNKKKSIKDKDNIIGYNSWSGGDYSKNLDGTFISNGVTRNLSQNWSSNGSNSFYVEFQTSDSWKWIDLFRIYENRFESGNYTLELDTYGNTINYFDIVLFNESNISIVRLPVSESRSHITLTGDIVNSKYLSCRCISLSSGSCFFDNVKIYKR